MPRVQPASGQNKPVWRRPVIHEMQGIIFDAPLQKVKKPCCSFVGCIKSCCGLFTCQCLECCKVFNMYPPLYESAYTRVTLSAIIWNRPYMKKRVEYYCCGLCVDHPQRRCCGFGGGVGSLFNVVDDIKVAHYDSFKEAIISEPTCYSKICLCESEKYVTLVDINDRWPHWCHSCFPCCCSPAPGETIHYVDYDFLEAFVKQINLAREASLRRGYKTGTFYTPAFESLDNLHRDEIVPSDYYQSTLEPMPYEMI